MNNENAQGQLYIVGTRGYSAYEVAVQEGFEGTEEEWLASLVGPIGPKGPEGKSAYEVAVAHGYEGSEEEWASSFLTPYNYYTKEDMNAKLNEVNISESYNSTTQELTLDVIFEGGNE